MTFRVCSERHSLAVDSNNAWSAFLERQPEIETPFEGHLTSRTEHDETWLET